MKKILALALAALLLAMAVLPVAAASSNMSISAGSSTAYRGDTVNFTIRMATVEDCKSGGIVLNYDNKVFEFVTGNCEVGGASMSAFNAGTGTFAFSAGTSVGGVIFTFQLRVRSDAAFGTYTVSGTPNARTSDGSSVNMSISGASVTVACKHEYSAWTQVDEATHTRTCSICNTSETQAHNRDGIFVSQNATCKSTGSRIVTCTDCNYQVTETIPISYYHSYNGWSYTSETLHSGTCAVCGQKASMNHTWDEGTVILAPTCISQGERTLVCTATGCNATKNEVMEATGIHTYQFPCDTQCTVCGETREAAHEYADTWTSNKQSHFRACIHCGHQDQLGDHTPGAEPTANTAQTCTICGFIIKPSLNHVHEPSEAWVTDEAGHWHSCPGCSELLDYTVHDFENVCDPLCESCGFTRDTAHDYAQEFSFDETTHFYVCSGCGDHNGTAFHTPGDPPTEFDAQVCVVCGSQINPPLGHSFGTYWVYDDLSHFHSCSCGEIADKADHTFGPGVEENGVMRYTCTVCGAVKSSLPPIDWRLAVILGVPFVLGAGIGILVTALIKRKRR